MKNMNIKSQYHIIEWKVAARYGIFTNCNYFDDGGDDLLIVIWEIGIQILL